MITINLSEKDAEVLNSGCNYLRSIKAFNDNEVNKNVIQQINNQQFDASDFESSRQYESIIVNAAYIDKTVWDKAKKNVGFGEG
ncbi:hypothetical protein N0N85_004442 [Escherichia coli]|nr:hypothetical protein [Escherichia coli]